MQTNLDLLLRKELEIPGYAEVFQVLPKLIQNHDHTWKWLINLIQLNTEQSSQESVLESLTLDILNPILSIQPESNGEIRLQVAVGKVMGLPWIADLSTEPGSSKDVWTRVQRATDLICLFSGQDKLWFITYADVAKGEHEPIHHTLWLTDHALNSLPPGIRLERESIKLPALSPEHYQDIPTISGGWLKEHDLPLGTGSDVLNILASQTWSLTPSGALGALPADQPDPTNHPHFLKAWNASTALLGANTFHFQWQYDTRGRIYPFSYPVNFHGFEWARAHLDFGEAELIC